MCLNVYSTVFCKPLLTGEGGQGSPVGRGYLSMAKKRKATHFGLNICHPWTNFSHGQAQIATARTNSHGKNK